MRKGALDYISHIRTLAGRTRNALPTSFFLEWDFAHFFSGFGGFFVASPRSVEVLGIFLSLRRERARHDQSGVLPAMESSG